MNTSFISESTDQELSMQELAATNGGLVHAPTGPVMKVIDMGLKKVGEKFWDHVQNHYARKGPMS